MDPEFTLVMNKRKPSSPPLARNEKLKRIKPSNLPLPTRNSYAVLSDTSDEEEEMNTEEENTPSVSTQPRPRPVATKSKPARIPGLVLHGNPSNVDKLKAFIEKHTKNKSYEIKYGHNRTTIYVKDQQAYKDIKEKLQEKTFNFHTYTSEEDRTHSFVLCGLSEQTTLEELTAELENIENLHFKKAYKLNNTRRLKFLVITENKVTEKSINNIRIIMNTRITWERYYNNKKFTQCHRCQGWGHATSNCYAEPNCLKCAKKHFTKDCDLQEDDEPKCVNCGGPHTANHTGCPVYKRLLESYEKRKSATNQRPVSNPVPDVTSQTDFQPLPKPKVKLSNVWRRSEESNNENKSESNSDFDEMMRQFDRLNNVLNMKKFTENLKNLNDRLEQCKSESQKFQVMQSFYMQLDRNGP